MSQRGNLTGNPRQVRDLAAELHSLVQQWNLQHLSGVQLLKSMTAYIRFNVDDIVVCMETLTRQLKLIAELESLRGSNNSPMFLTWPTIKFGDVASCVSEAYSMECKVKKHVKENIAHSKSKEALMFLMAAWVHQCYIEPEVEVGLEALLHETGLR
uniref:Cyclin-dependent kinase 2-interacting protein n=1 Tax=Timema poppense TaxID=170557 RepID=A0A7R9DMC0_TIMPO|nr:unnamed protein product [Timema poppensis]